MDGIRTHVFLSFANVDVDIVRRLATRLQAEGVAVWTGDEKLTPGTVDWEQAVRGAIDASFAVVLVASPASARSVYVRGELGIADTRGLPLFSVWVQGESWADCAPLMLTSSQYVDCRGEEFERGTSALADVLRPLAERAIPNHFAHPLLAPFPLSCISVALPSSATAHGTSGASAAILKINEYASLEALLDELHANYLREHYEPLTYGKSWMLVEAGTDAFAFVVAPWSWLTGAPIDRHWVRRHSPADCHLLPGTSWQVTAVPSDAYGVALADPRVLDALRATAKSDLAMRRDGYLAFQSVSDVDTTAFPSTIVCRSRSRFWRDEEVKPHMALVQVKPVPEDELQWYLSYRVP
jgi:TIR domain